MASRRIKWATCLFTAINMLSLTMTQAQSTPSTGSPTPSATSSSSSPGATAQPGGTGSYSIEAEILAYKSLAVNSNAIAADINNLLSAKTSILIVPSVSTILPSFQLWRANMLTVQSFLDQGKDGFPCPAPGIGGSPSFAAIATGISQGVGVIQSILALFATSQNVTGLTGTIQDQALMMAVSRALKANQVTVIAPDVFPPWEIANIDPDKFPFIGQLKSLIVLHGKLQGGYQCSSLVVAAGTQLQQAESAREADYAKLADPGAKAADRTSALVDITKLKPQIVALRQKMGLGADPAIQQAENDITRQGLILATAATTAKEKSDAMDEIRTADAKSGEVEVPVILQASQNAAKTQSLVTGIESYLAGLTGGSISFTTPAANASAPAAGSTTPASSPGGTNSSPASPASAAPTAATATPTASPTASASPPIVTILLADGLAYQMGFKVNDLTFQGDSWRILWVKSLESGGSITTLTNIFGNHPYFSGGAVSGYALFKLDGTLLCSGNAAAYGGLIKAKDFAKEGVKDARSMLDMQGKCSP